MINPFEMDKIRELWFATEPTDQVSRAMTLLSGLPNLTVLYTSKNNILEIRYNLHDYTLAGLEHALENEGFILDRSFLHHVGRNVIYYCEDTARHNMEIRGHITKKNERDVFLGVSGTHANSGHAAKPPELREYE